MVCKLENWLGLGSNPKLHLELGDNGPGWDKYNIDYGQMGNVPWSNDPIKRWAAWNVKDEIGNYYGSIIFNHSDGNSVNFEKYNKYKSFWLDGITLTNISGTNYQLKCTGIHRPVSAPPIIPNLGWASGMGNEDSKPTDGDCFWVQDYGVDEPGRWLVDPQAGLFQSTANINGNFGSRAYPVRIKQSGQNWEGLAGVGAGFEGLWLIAIQIGSNGRGDNPFCETFYLAERNSFEWGPAHYGDGSGTAAYYSREVDIMETKWHAGGVNLNLPQGGGTSWNPNPDWGIANRFNPGRWPMWSDVGGAPTKNSILFGCLIWNDNLWLFAYTLDSKNIWRQWYCTKPIPKNNSTYVQKYPFAPYIGTWCQESNKQPGGFRTGYNVFIYWDKEYIGKVHKISRDNINPYNNPDDFIALIF